MLSLNILELVTNKNDVQIHGLSYDGNWEKFKKLRIDYPAIEFYLWHGSKDVKSKVYCWQNNQTDLDAIPKGFTPETISNELHPAVWSRIIESAFVKLFRDNGREIYKPKGTHTWNLKLQGDNNDRFTKKGINLAPILKFSFNFLKPTNASKLIYGISIWKSFKSEFTLTEEEFRKSKIDTRKWDKNEDGEIVPSISNVKKLLEATGEYSNFQAFRRRAYSAIVEYENLELFHKKFHSIKDRIILPNSLKITDIILNNVPDSNFEVSYIQKPVYYFHNESTGNGYYNDRLKALKPSSYDFFKGKEVKILVLTPLEFEGSTGSFSTKLINVLKDTFHLNVIRETKAFDHRVAYAYTNLQKKLDVSKYDLVFQVVSQIDKSKEIAKSPYFVLKAKMLNQRVPTQKVLIETIRASNRQIIDSIALNIYSKLGGTAWTIEKDEKEKTEIIIGIGSTVDFQKNRIMGFANVLDYNGSYITGDCTQIADFTTYKDNLEKHLINTIEEVIKIKNIQDGEKSG